jgi:hypothetical protein
MKDWHREAEQLAADNTRLRNGILTIKDRVEHLSHVKMNDGSTLHQFCRSLIVGPTPELAPRKDEVA